MSNEDSSMTFEAEQEEIFPSNQQPSSSSSSINVNSATTDPSDPYSQDVVDPELTFKIFTNDGDPESSVALITLKNIFSRQLPKMPRDYIVRLVFDRRHYSLGILKQGRIVGGVCYRPYFDQKFAEIAFCAISGQEQVKGYGTLLLNQLKTHVQREKLEYFLTYADNYAIGYFQKQGFSKSVNMPKERWVGYVKEYDGGLFMECYVHPAVDYLSMNRIVGSQRAFIHQQLEKTSRSGTVYPGLEVFQQGKRLQSILDAPGVGIGGWTVQGLYKGATERDRTNAYSKLAVVLKSQMDKIKHSPYSGPFKEMLPDSQEYEDTIKDPINLETIAYRLKLGDYYRSIYKCICIYVLIHIHIYVHISRNMKIQ
mmetsp:Transcript_19509/g.18844  ORF Transcript_19509/g.18844 Transcript_19509/m.18844 type:complete len:368 (+) Transcript_19509:114-1217(+)